jgi:predicted CoA-binding protein
VPIIDTDVELARLLREARTIAVVGLSATPSRDSYRVARYLQDHGYAIIPVNPGQKEVLGVAAVADLAAIGRPVDIVNVFRRKEFLPAIAAEAVRTGARALWMQFDTVHDLAIATADRGGMNVVADRCIMVEHRRLLA